MDTEGGGQASQKATECQSRCKKGHMTNIYLTDSDEEAIGDFVKDHEDLTTKPMRKLRTKPERIACWKESQVATTSR